MPTGPEFSSALDQHPLNSPLSRLVRRAPVTCPPETSIRTVLTVMQREDVGSMVICGEDQHPLGIFTLHDLLYRVALEQRGLDQPISEVMRTKLITLPPDALAYEAALAMARNRIRHILIVENGRLRGVISERDLFSLQIVSLRVISSGIRAAQRPEELVPYGVEIRNLAHALLEQGIGAEQLTQFISTLNDMLTQRVIELELAAHDLAGIEVCWIAMGSEGRFEQTLSTDQDNGIIFRCPPDREPGRAREILLPVAQRINRILADCGFPLCKGEIMAGNAKWCLSLHEWKRIFASWIHRADAPELLNATIFFDFRALFGEACLADELRAALHALIEENRLFLRRMVENALANRPPLGVLRDFALSDKDGEPHTIDLKVNGITPFVDAARVFSLSAAVDETNTARRLRAAAGKLGIETERVEAWVDAFYFIQLLRLRNHHKQVIESRPLSNRIDPYTLNDLDRTFLKESLKQARKIQGVMEKLFQF